MLGTPETLAEYRSFLLSSPDRRHRLRIHPDGTKENLGRIAEDVHPALDVHLRLRAQRQLRDRFGGVDQARDVLRALTAVLDDLDDPSFDELVEDEPPTKRRRGDASPNPSS